MDQHKYIQFNNVADLRAKLTKLQEIVDRNRTETEAFLIIQNIPFSRLDEGFGVDLAEVDNDRLTEYFNKFEEQGRTTREQFQDLGVVYITRPSPYVDHQIDLETRKN